MTELVEGVDHLCSIYAYKIVVTCQKDEGDVHGSFNFIAYDP